MKTKEDVIIALLREVLGKLDDATTPAESAPPSLDGIERELKRIREGQTIIFAAVGEIYQRLDATDAFPAYLLEHEAAVLFRENFPEHGPQPKAMKALAAVKNRLESYSIDQLREHRAFYRDKIEQGDPYAHQAAEALRSVESELSRREAIKGPELA